MGIDQKNGGEVEGGEVFAAGGDGLEVIFVRPNRLGKDWWWGGIEFEFKGWINKATRNVVVVGGGRWWRC